MGVNDYIQIGNRIKELRQYKGIKQKEMAAKLGIPISTYANYENNHREPTSNILDSIAEILETTVSDLIGFETLNAFVAYLESIGYKVKVEHDEVIESHEEEMIKNGKINGHDKVIDKATYLYHISKDGIKATFTEVEFEKFKDEIKKSVEVQIYFKNKK